MRGDNPDLATPVPGTLLTINLLFGILFLVIGALNVWLVHPVPGIIYFVISVLYFPATDVLTKKHLGFSIPPVAKVVFGLIVLWGTLAVTDLADILGL